MPGGSRGKVVLMTGGYDHTIRFWEVHTGICIKTLQYPDSPINLLRVSPDKRWLAVAGNPLVRLYRIDMSSQGHTHSFQGHSANVTSMMFTPGPETTTLWTGSEDHSIKLWDLRAASSQKEFKCRFPVNSVALHPTRPVLLSGDQGGYIRLWDLRMGRYLRELQPEGDSSIRWLSVAPNGKLLAAVTNSGTCFVWKLGSSEGAAQKEDEKEANKEEEKGKQASTSNGSAEAHLSDSAASPEGAAASIPTTDGDHSTKTGGLEGCEMRPLKQLQAHATYALKCLFSPDSRLLATSSADHTVKLWSIPSFKQEHTFSGHQRWVWDCEFSSDSNFLVTGSSDNTARSWNLTLGDTICHFNGHHKAIVSVALCDTSS